jgi:hypothetical protein
MNRAYYSDTINEFLVKNKNEILGVLVSASSFAVEQSQRDAWLEEIDILKNILQPYTGAIYFEYAIPRMGKRIDVVLIIGSIIFVLEFKVGEKEFPASAIDQVWDYALDLKYFHETSHNAYIAPVLLSTKAKLALVSISPNIENDKTFLPIKCNEELLSQVIEHVIGFTEGPRIDRTNWEVGRYQPTPTIIEAAKALYNGHSVVDISRKEADDTNIDLISDAIFDVIDDSKKNRRKSICFITGVPGSGKTLVGLNIATKYSDKTTKSSNVFLSGNGPLVNVLQEALARDRVEREKQKGEKVTKAHIKRLVKSFIQNVHNFRDESLNDVNSPPHEHVAIFDEAQRAWELTKTASYMKTRKGKSSFQHSESEFLISCLDRHSDWAVIVCLVGGGQEIHTGEAGIGEWLEALNRSFQHWHIFISSRLTDSEYGAGTVLEKIIDRNNVIYMDNLHLSVSMRSFRAENVALLVKQLLDLEPEDARITLKKINDKYPIVITRDFNKAKEWLRKQARGSERYGMIVSSQAERLKPHAIYVKSPVDPIHWFLNGKDDVRSSYYLEDVVTEFQIQGLELDWACVTWDADLRYSNEGWKHFSFEGNRWNRINKPERQNYLKNAYRVLLTRARQGMVIVIPNGDENDPTRKSEYYDPIYDYLKGIGFNTI